MTRRPFETRTRRSADALADDFKAVVCAAEDDCRLGMHKVWLEMAGRRVRFSIVGERLAQMFLTACRHLLIEPPHGSDLELALDIEVWDEAASGRPRSVRDLRDCLDDCRPFGRAILGQCSDTKMLFYQSPSLFGILDLEQKRLVAAVEDAGRLSLFERGKPLQPLLFAWHSSIGATPIHAALVARDGVGALIGGSGGSGKSTTSLLCWQEGFEYLGDDYIALTGAAAGKHAGHSFYTSTWLTREHSERFPRLAERAHVGGEGEDKLLVLLNEVDDCRLARSSEVGVVLLPRVVGGAATVWRRATKSEAMLRLAPSSILQLPFIDPQAALDRMGELLASVPSFWLDLGTDFPAIPKAVASILSEIRNA